MDGTPVAPSSGILNANTSPINFKRLDESLWWESFTVLLEELDSAPPLSDADDSLANTFRRNHTWLLNSVSSFKLPNEASRRALNSTEISVGVHNLVVEPKLKEAALQASKFLSLDEVQTYILVSRSVEHDGPSVSVEGKNFFLRVLLQYFIERQCLLKCIRHIFVNSLCWGRTLPSNAAFKKEAKQLIHDRLEVKLLSVLKDLLSSAPYEKILQDAELITLWVDETIIEDILILDILFLAYYDNFCVCNAAQWMSLCSLFKDIIGGSFSIESFAVSVEARALFTRVKVQLLLMLIVTLDLETLLRLVHDEVNFSDGGFVFLLQDVQEMDCLISTFSGVGIIESGPLFLAWAVFICLLSSFPDLKSHKIVMEIDHVDYARQAFEVGTFKYLLEVLHGDCLRDSDGLISGFMTILRTLMSAFIASFELSQQAEENTLSLILKILCKIYEGEESLSNQFWDRDSFIDGPIRSLLYMLENEYPYHIIELLHFLSALCNGSWSAECVFNFLDKMNGMTVLYESVSGSPVLDSYGIVEAHQRISVPGVEGFFIPFGTRGQILKAINVNNAKARWEFTHSGIYLLVLRAAQASHSNGYDEVKLIFDLLYQLVSSNVALCFKLLHLDDSLYTQLARNNGLIEQNMLIDVVKVICSLTIRFIEDGGHASIVGVCFNILAELVKCAPSHAIDTVMSSNILCPTNISSSRERVRGML